jgi:hypothetical protein
LLWEILLTYRQETGKRDSVKKVKGFRTHYLAVSVHRNEARRVARLRNRLTDSLDIDIELTEGISKQRADSSGLTDVSWTYSNIG